MFDKPYNGFPYPTKIPAGRLELTFEPPHAAKSFRLDLRQAVGRVELGGATLEAFYSAEEPVAILRVTGAHPTWRILAPAALKKLGSPPAEMGSDGAVKWYLQEAALGLKYAAVVASRQRGDGLEIALTVASTQDGPDPVAIGRQRVADALAAGYGTLLKPHEKWWADFWSRSGVRVPDPAVQGHYDLVQYFYGAASRRGAPPMPLQGVWTADAGGLPPWKGDYHHDLNTQFTYYAYQAAGRFDQGACFLDFMWNHLPAHRTFAKTFYGTDGAAVPGVMTLDGKAMGGWGQYSLSPTMGAWVAHLFYLHWRYTMDREFLADRAYPYTSAIGECLCGLLKPGPDGKLKLPLSTSPEIHNNSLRAWLTPNTNNDLALLRCLFGSLVEMADALGEKQDSARWQGVLDRLDDLAVEGEAGALKLSRDESLHESHRHHAHLMSIHPLGVLHTEGTERDRKIIAACWPAADGPSRRSDSSRSISRRSSRGTASTSTATRAARDTRVAATARSHSKATSPPARPCMKCSCKVGAGRSGSSRPCRKSGRMYRSRTSAPRAATGCRPSGPAGRRCMSASRPGPTGRFACGNRSAARRRRGAGRSKRSAPTTNARCGPGMFSMAG